ncbi:NAD(P)H-binding protein [Azospirillum sp. RWY-5-1]|uniref:NAD(P)H-binding protein n=1 Tax=Azospirillum oleiclasticum TaxID=2735135 RepID=A0ABX2TK23_9PROT|nr:NAD(P)H-binding protein [Azospirillum oleiclasticum]NYZ14609.1 NAD(P)H-binding protein [Azospirillum oleiclasticum]NYZ24387.1 NAD(P)H-binding protein [Azospirillum oleiclasticum]
MRRIGLLGATGAVGRSVLHHLRLAGAGPLRLGGRNAGGLQTATLPGEEVVPVDITEPEGLRAFCTGCAVVVNAAGPTRLVMDCAVRAALDSGADYVDAAGDEPVHALLSALPLPTGRRAVLSAGIMPGLTALLPRHLATELPDARVLTAHAGGLDRFTRTAAGDYVASLANGHGEPMAAWRGGRARRALVALHDVAIPFFPHPVSAFPYLSRENERVAGGLGLERADWYNVFAGRHLREAFGDVQHRLAAIGEEEAIDLLCRATALDLAGRTPYQIMVCRLENRARARVAVVRGTDGYALSGAFAAFAALAVRDGALPPGLHFAGEVMDTASALAQLRTSPAVAALELLDIAPTAAAVPAFDDGVL